MKPKDYIRKYNLDMSEHFNHSAFVADLTVDFQSQIDYQKSVGQYSLSHFENIVKQMKQKFDGIANKFKMSLDKWEKLWKFFYASVVAKAKEIDFGDLLAKQKAAREEKWRRDNAWKYHDSSSDDSYFHFGGAFFEQLFRMFFGSEFGRSYAFGNIFENVVPEDSFTKLNLTSDCSIEDVNVSFRKLALQHHPDKGSNYLNKI